VIIMIKILKITFKQKQSFVLVATF